MLSKRCLSVEQSLTLAISSKAKALKKDGFDVVGFGAGEPDFNTPDYVIEAAKEAMEKGLTKYTPASGMLELKKTICEKLMNENGLEYSHDQILISNGAKHSIYNTLQVLLNDGDEVIIPNPYWVTYPESVKLAGGVPVFVEANAEDGFVMKPNAIEAVINEKTKAIIVNSPNNPTGGVYSEDDLRAIADIAIKNNLYVLSDEIYEKLIYDGQKHVSIASFGERIKELTIVINGMSKAYAMTGWRIGYAAASKEIVSVMSNIQSHATSNPNSIAQYASIAALNGSKEVIDKMVDAFNQRRQFMYEKINNIDGLSCRLPKGAFYTMMNISECIGKSFEGKEIKGSMDFSELLLNSKQVAVVPGVAFGSDDYVRLSYATSKENIEKGLNRIKEFVSQLK